MINILKIGADVELFLKDSRDRAISAVGLIGGTKKKPRPIDNEGSALQEDNVMLEFNIIPAENSEQFRNNINKVIVHAIEELRSKNLLIDISGSKVFSRKALKNPQARTIGCDPDFSAWTFQANELLSHKKLKNVRTSGGHVHVSYMVDGDPPEPIHHTNMIRMMDLYLGVPSVLLDDDNVRRQFYGRAGAFRIKAQNHIEYRTLSNFWVKNDSLKEWVFDNVVECVRQLNYRQYHNLWGEHLKDEVTSCIKTGDKELAEKLIHEYRIGMP